MLIREFRETLSLAVPLAAIHVALMMMGVVDTACVGHFSGTELGAVAIGNAIAFSLAGVGFGIAFALEPLASQAVGAREFDSAWHWWRVVLRVNLWAAVPLTALIFVVVYSLSLFGVAPALEGLVADYSWARSPALIFHVLFITCRSYLQSHQKTRAVLFAALIGNLVNLPINLLLIFGDDGLTSVGLPRIGLPALGGVGAGIATTISSGLMAWMVMRVLRDEKPSTVMPRRITGAEARKALMLGLPLGLQTAAEMGIFTTVAILAGKLGGEIAGAHQIALNLAALSFMCTLGIGGAASVRVGQAIGRGDSLATRRAGLIAAGSGLVVMMVSATTFLLIPDQLVQLFTDDPLILPIAAKLIRIAALFQLFDGLQAVMTGALRGAGDIRVPVIANIVAHWAIGFPVAWILAFESGLGAVGLWYGLTAGLVVIGLALSLRFFWITRGEIDRV